MKLTTEKRTITGKGLVGLRKKDILPGVVYAKHMDQPLLVQCRRQDFVKTYKAGGTSTVVELTGEGLDEQVLIHDMQIDPVTHKVTHVDFKAIKKGEAIEAEVSIELIGKAPVITSAEISIQQLKDTVTIKAKPKDLPHNLDLDISTMEDEDAVLFVKDIIVPKGVEIIDDADLALARVATAKGGNNDTEETTTTEETDTPAAK